MTAKNKSSFTYGSLVIKFVPLAGIIIFVVLYIVAALVYPGGNYLDHNAEGFSILHNYWCDLLNPIAQNGKSNPSSSIAITAMVIVCSSLTPFWYYLPNAFEINKYLKATIRTSGIISMIIGMTIFTRFHDEAITWSGFFGGIAFMATFLGLYKSGWFKIFSLGIVCVVLGVITFTIYKTREGLIILPMIQKITLLLCLIWVALININLIRQQNSIAGKS